MPRTRCCDCTVEPNAEFVNLTVSGHTELDTLETLGLAELACLIVDTTTLVVDCLNNRVGINTVSPSVDFEVLGDGIISGDFDATGLLYVRGSNDRVGIGDISPDAGFEIATTSITNVPMVLVSGTQTINDTNSDPYFSIVGVKAGNALSDAGFYVNTAWQNSSPLTTISQASILGNVSQGSSTLTNLNTLLLQPTTTNTYAGTITNSYTLHIENASLVGGSTLTNQYGIYVDNISGAGTLNYALYTNSGLVRFGGNTAVVGSDFTVDTTLFHVDSTNNKVFIGALTASDALLTTQGTLTNQSGHILIPAITSNDAGFDYVLYIEGSVTTTVGSSAVGMFTTLTPTVNVGSLRMLDVRPTITGGVNITSTLDIARFGGVINTSAGTITQLAMVHINSPTLTAGTVTNRIGLLIDSMPASSSANLAISTGAVGYVNFGDRMGVGQTSPTGKAHINQSSSTGAIPSLHLEQDDVSEEFVRYTGQATNANITQSLVATASVGSFTVNGYLKINIQDEGNQITDGNYYIAFGTLA